MKRIITVVAAMALSVGWGFLVSGCLTESKPQPDQTVSHVSKAPDAAQSKPKPSATKAAERVPRDVAWFFRRMVDIEWIAHHEPGVRCRQFSSYDRRSKIVDGKKVDWDANGDAGNYLRQTEEEGNVMAEMDGPGCIVQFWSANPGGTIRIWLDGEAKPTIEMPMAELLSDRGGAPFTEPFCYQVRPSPNDHTASNCYFPIPYAKSCKVAVVGHKQYYNIDYVTYPKGTPVQTFKLPLTAAQQEAVKLAARQIMKGMPILPARLEGMNVKATVATPGKEIELVKLTRPDGGIVREVSFKAESPDTYRLRKAILKIYWDDAKQPGVVAPLGEFFGTGWFPTPYQSLVSRIDKDGTMTSYWPMPFKKSCRVTMTNLSHQPLQISGAIKASEPRTACECKPMYFHAMYRREKLGKTFDYPFAQGIVGPGRGVGNLLNIDNPQPGWWGEGDEKVWVDDDAFPSWWGTGSEDYYNDAWGMHLHARFQEGCPLLQGPDHSNKTSMYRWHILDSIPFEETFTMTIENYHGSWGRVPSDYSSVAYYYNAKPEGAPFFKPLTPADLLPCNFRPSGTVEAETLDYAAGVKKNMEQLAKLGLADVASGTGAVELVPSTKPDQQTDVPLGLLAPGVYRVHAYLLSPKQVSDLTVVWKAQPGATLHVAKLGTLPAGSSAVDIGLLFVQADKPVAPILGLRAGRNSTVYLDAVRVEKPPTHGIEAETVAWTSPDHLVTIKTDLGNTALSGWGQVTMETLSVGGLVAMPVDLKPGCYEVSGRLGCGPDFGQLRVRMDVTDTLLTKYEGYADKPGLRDHGFGRFVVAKGKTLTSLEFMICGKNPKSKGTRMAIDYLEIRPCKSLTGYEGEDLRVIKVEHGAASTQHLGPPFSRESQKFITFGSKDGWVQLGFDLPKAGTYEVVMAFCKSHDYATLETYVDGQKIGPRLDNYSPQIVSTGPVTFGAVELKAGPHVLEFRVVGKNEKSQGYYMGLDYVDLLPK